MNVLAGLSRAPSPPMRSAGVLALGVSLLVGLPLAVGLAAAIAAVAPAPAAAADDGSLRVLLFYKPNFHASHVAGPPGHPRADHRARHGVRPAGRDPGDRRPRRVHHGEPRHQGHAGLRPDRRRAVQRGPARRARGLHPRRWRLHGPALRRLVGRPERARRQPVLRPPRRRDVRGPPREPRRSARAAVVVKDAAHPLTQGLPADFTRSDEWYDWLVNPAPNVRTLLEADESSYAGGGRNGTLAPDHLVPGRSTPAGPGTPGWATRAPPTPSPSIRTQMKNGLAYSAGLLPGRLLAAGQGPSTAPGAASPRGRWSRSTRR